MTAERLSVTTRHGPMIGPDRGFYSGVVVHGYFDLEPVILKP